MADLLMVLTFVVFILGCVVYVMWFDRIIGPDPVRSGGEGEEGAEPSRPAEREVLA